MYSKCTGVYFIKLLKLFVHFINNHQGTFVITLLSITYGIPYIAGSYIFPVENFPKI